MNMGGLIVLLVGAFIVVVGLRGTQSQVFPFFFGQGSGAVNPYSAANLGLPPVTSTNQVPSVNGTCPAGSLPSIDANGNFTCVNTTA